MPEAVIVATGRTPIGRANKGSLVDVRADELMATILGALMDKLPMAAAAKGAVSADQGDRELRRQIAIINSMTPRERRVPGVIDGSRRRRIARGAGVQVQDVNRLMKQFLDMQRMMKSMKGGKLRQLLGALKGGGMPPGMNR